MRGGFRRKIKHDGRDPAPVVRPLRTAPKHRVRPPKVPVRKGWAAFAALTTLRFRYSIAYRKVFWEMLQQRVTPPELKIEGRVLPYPDVFEYLTAEDVLAVIAAIDDGASRW